MNHLDPSLPNFIETEVPRYREALREVMNNNNKNEKVVKFANIFLELYVKPYRTQISDKSYNDNFTYYSKTYELEQNSSFWTNDKKEKSTGTVNERSLASYEKNAMTYYFSKCSDFTTWDTVDGVKRFFNYKISKGWDSFESFVIKLANNKFLTREAKQAARTNIPERISRLVEKRTKLLSALLEYNNPIEAIKALDDIEIKSDIARRLIPEVKCILIKISHKEVLSEEEMKKMKDFQPTNYSYSNKLNEGVLKDYFEVVNTTRFNNARIFQKLGRLDRKLAEITPKIDERVVNKDFSPLIPYLSPLCSKVNSIFAAFVDRLYSFETVKKVARWITDNKPTFGPTAYWNLFLNTGNLLRAIRL